MTYSYWKSCPEITSDELDAHRTMCDDSKDITRASFRKAVGADDLNRWALDRGYEPPGSRGLTLAKDWHVSYAVSHWNGERCYFITWSAFEFIWRAQGP